MRTGWSSGLYVMKPKESKFIQQPCRTATKEGWVTHAPRGWSTWKGRGTVVATRHSKPGVWRFRREDEEGFFKKEEGFRDRLFPHLLFIKNTPGHITRNENICLKHNPWSELESGWCGSLLMVLGSLWQMAQEIELQSCFLLALPSKLICRWGYFPGSKYVICQAGRA